MENDTGVFYEVQRLRFWWVWAIVIFTVLLMWFFFVAQIILGYKLGSKPAPDFIIIILWVCMGIVFPVLFLMVGLKTRVAGDGLYFRFLPFSLKEKKISFPDITACEAVEYKPILEYGGWGIRRGREGWAYTISGNKGVKVTTSDGKVVLIGSRKADELATAINDLRK